jgi:hypothetical protein
MDSRSDWAAGGGVMGCDVHPVIEVCTDPEHRDHKDDWECVAIPDRTRCYPLFGALAGVRWDESRQIVEPRGLPNGMHWHSEEIVDGDHTPSWFTLREALAYDAEWLKSAYVGSDFPYQIWQRWLRTMVFFRDEYGVTDDDVRAVFNFDS